MSGGERRASTTQAVGDLVVQPSPVYGESEFLKEGKEKLEMLQIDGHPVFEDPEFWKKHDEEQEVLRAVRDDNKDEFLRVVKSPRFGNSEKFIFGREIIDEQAVRCAAAVLAGETNGIIDPHFGFPAHDGWTVLHHCAVNLSLEITTMLIERGYSADVRGDYDCFNLKQPLPLNVALYQLRHICLLRFLASQNRTPAKLLIGLCPKDNLLKILRLFALNTRDFKHEFFNYAKEGKMVEVGALLLAAGEKLMPLRVSEGEDVIVFNSFKEISDFLQAKNTSSATSNDESTDLKGTLLLLDIYDKIGDQLTTYVRFKKKKRHEIPGLVVATLIENAGFDVKIDDLNVPKFKSSVPRQTWSWSYWAGDKSSGKQSANRFPSFSELPPFQTFRHLFHTSSFRSRDSKYASLAPSKKSVTALQNPNSCKRWASFMTIFQRGVRRV